MNKLRSVLIALSMAMTIVNIVLIKRGIDEVDEMKEAMDTMSASEEFMKLGAKDERPYFLIGDEEEDDFRYERMPYYGVSQEHPFDIPISGGSEGDKQYIADLLYYLPSGIKEYMIDNAWQVQIVKEITDIPGHKAPVIGHTDFKTKLIRITMDEPYTVYHEIGHIIYRENLRALKSDTVTEELKTLCCHSADGLLYVYMNRTEQICESLYDYIWYPKEMQTQAPELYRIFNNYLDEEPYKMYTKIKD